MSDTFVNWIGSMRISTIPLLLNFLTIEASWAVFHTVYNKLVVSFFRVFDVQLIKSKYGDYEVFS